MKFIENALDCISKKGICVAICQMSTVVSAQKNVTKVKERLLDNHTLKAVFSMSDDLFYPICVVTYIIVFEARSPHSVNKETFFGYFKNDGFVKTKHKGKIDQNRQWQDIKEKWLGAYTHHDDMKHGTNVIKFTKKG